MRHDSLTDPFTSNIYQNGMLYYAGFYEEINLEKKKELEIGGDLLEAGTKGGDCDEPRYVEENCCHHNLQCKCKFKYINTNTL